MEEVIVKQLLILHVGIIVPVLSSPLCCQHGENLCCGTVSSMATRQDVTLAPQVSLSHPCTAGMSSQALASGTSRAVELGISSCLSNTPTQPLPAATKGETCHHREQIS